MPREAWLLAGRVGGFLSRVHLLWICRARGELSLGGCDKCTVPHAVWTWARGNEESGKALKNHRLDER